MAIFKTKLLTIVPLAVVSFVFVGCMQNDRSSDSKSDEAVIEESKPYREYPNGDEPEAPREYPNGDEPEAPREYPNGDEPEATREAGAITTLTIAGVNVNFHWAPAGTFMMGSPESEKGRFAGNREKQHEVTLTKGFWIAETETTLELWKAVKRDDRREGSSQEPVESISWNDCQHFVDNLNHYYSDALPSGYKYALPTEAQWEYACRAGTSTAFNVGSSLNDDQAHYAGSYSYDMDKRGRRNVKSYAPNAWGLYDMHGNVEEWCSDWYDENFYASSLATEDPEGPNHGSLHVLRGGSFESSARNCRSAFRRMNGPDILSSEFGFRLVLIDDSYPYPLVSLPEDATEDVTQEAGSLQTLEIAGVNVNFHWAPAGSFQMGSPESEHGHDQWEFRHEVILTRGFWIAETETTQELWQAVMGSNPSKFKGSSQLPVECVSWEDCQDFVNMLNCNYSKILPSGYRYALPTEAQWEYACRAGTATAFNIGDDLNDNEANFDRSKTYSVNSNGVYNAKTTPVKSYKANAWGLYDMHGNVYEWTSDWYHRDYYLCGTSAITDPTGPVTGSGRVVRGGSWSRRVTDCRSANRDGSTYWQGRDECGFRLVIARDVQVHAVHIDDAQVAASSVAIEYPNGDEPEVTREAGALKSLNINGVEVNFHWSPAGSFLMGSPVSEGNRYPNEEQHEVELTQGFWIAETVTTQKLWQAVMGNNHIAINDITELPVNNISWHDCQEFVDKLNTSCSNVLPDGYQYAMPTEAQWEYACRAGTTTPFNFGVKLNGDNANCDGSIPYGTSTKGNFFQKTSTVKSYAPNKWGLYDMHGNLFEWCADRFDNYDTSVSPVKDPVGSTYGFGQQRVYRGGAWTEGASECRSARRGHDRPSRKGSNFGFRLVLVRKLQAQDSQADATTASIEYPDGEEPEVTREAGAVKTLTIAGVALNFHWAPAGTFMMGSPDSEEGHMKGEPLHEVELTQGFWIAETETTQELWRAVMGENPSNSSGSNQLPVDSISWFNCHEFVNKLNDNFSASLPEGFKFSMPTEAQWEYACRAGTTTPFSFGSTLNGNNANCDGLFPYPYGTSKGERLFEPTIVKSYAPNTWGLYDMHGNVFEWCLDWFDENYYDTWSASKDPKGPNGGSGSVLRGGSFDHDAEHCRSARRLCDEPDTHDNSVGFRLVLVSYSRPQASKSDDMTSDDVSTEDEEATTPLEYPDGDEPEATREAGAIKTLEIAGVDVNFHWAPAGTFMMGSPDDEDDRDDETQHEVTLTQGFWIAETETTQELWEAVMDENPSDFEGSSQLPVEQVSWEDCQEFVNELNSIYSDELPDGYKYSLPTEAQWEYACRAGTTTPFNFGSTLNGDKANCDGNFPYGTSVEGEYLDETCQVKSYEPNAWGLYDMHGNVAEWCVDWYDEDYYTSSDSAKNPKGPSSGSCRVQRGGYWSDSAESCRSAYRWVSEPDDRYNGIGVRLVLVPASQLEDSEPEKVESEDVESEEVESEDAPTEREYPNGDEPESTREAGAIKTLEIVGVEVNFHWAPAGTFMMGSAEDEDGHNSGESLHEVTLTHGFWIAETETTQELWQAVMDNNPSFFEGSNQLPVENVSWNDCHDFLEKLNSVYRNRLPTGYHFALPTEAQ